MTGLFENEKAIHRLWEVELEVRPAFNQPVLCCVKVALEAPKSGEGMAGNELAKK